MATEPGKCFCRFASRQRWARRETIGDKMQAQAAFAGLISDSSTKYRPGHSRPPWIQAQPDIRGDSNWHRLTNLRIQLLEVPLKAFCTKLRRRLRHDVFSLGRRLIAAWTAILLSFRVRTCAGYRTSRPNNRGVDPPLQDNFAFKQHLLS
jgi:hypothetical protein